LSGWLIRIANELPGGLTELYDGVAGKICTTPTLKKDSLAGAHSS
jgi:hypothetical protein